MLSEATPTLQQRWPNQASERQTSLGCPDLLVKAGPQRYFRGNNTQASINKMLDREADHGVTSESYGLTSCVLNAPLILYVIENIWKQISARR